MPAHAMPTYDKGYAIAFVITLTRRETERLRLYPDIADTSERADNGRGGASCQE
jgi:hypothetical protein